MHNGLLQYEPVYSNGNIQKPASCWSQTNQQPQDRSTIYRIGSVNLTISVQKYILALKNRKALFASSHHFNSLPYCNVKNALYIL